jgi:hypothetical protein
MLDALLHQCVSGQLELRAQLGKEVHLKIATGLLKNLVQRSRMTLGSPPLPRKQDKIGGKLPARPREKPPPILTASLSMVYRSSEKADI